MSIMEQAAQSQLEGAVSRQEEMYQEIEKLQSRIAELEQFKQEALESHRKIANHKIDGVDKPYLLTQIDGFQEVSRQFLAKWR